jgi:hypothetical protein
MVIESTIGPMRLLVDIPELDDKINVQEGPGGTTEITCEILDVLEPPAARARWLEIKAQIPGTSVSFGL